MVTPKVLAELDVLREFIEFVNRQVGVYCDCLSGFEGNKTRIERQVAIINHPVSRRVENEQTIIMRASVEDPNSPDIIHHRIMRATDFMSVNAEAGYNEQQICWSIITFLFAYWDEEIRPRIARIRGIEPNNIQIDAFGDLRILRNSLVHNHGMVAPNEYKKLRLLSSICTSGGKVAFTHDQMHKIFAVIKQAIAALILEHTSRLPGDPKPGEIVGIAIQNNPKRGMP